MKNTEEITTRWIPTEERQPQPFEVVLILYPRLYANMGEKKQSAFVCRLDRSFGWRNEDGEWLACYPKAKALIHNPPKYWMPLPAYDIEEYIPDKKVAKHSKTR